MTLALDTDVLVHWAMTGSTHHRTTREFIARELEKTNAQLGLTAQVLFEFIHVVSDARRFQAPMTMQEATGMTRELWDSPQTQRIETAPSVLHRTLDLLREHGLGRKRILDTVLAASLKEAAVMRLATFNQKHFEVFSFIEVVVPK